MDFFLLLHAQINNYNMLHLFGDDITVTHLYIFIFYFFLFEVQFIYFGVQFMQSYYTNMKILYHDRL